LDSFTVTSECLIARQRYVAFDHAPHRPIADGFLCLEQVLEQFSVVHHGASQLFRRRRASAMPFRDVARGAVVLDEYSVVDRKVGCALLEIRDRIAALPHHFRDEAIRLGDRATRIVDEQLLQVVPLLAEQVALVGGERTNVEVLDAFLPFDELGFGRALAARMGNRPVVLAAVLLMEHLCLVATGNRVPNDPADDGERDDDNSYQECWTHNRLLSGTLPRKTMIS
jgi:hypothetical protein